MLDQLGPCQTGPGALDIINAIFNGLQMLLLTILGNGLVKIRESALRMELNGKSQASQQ